LELSSPFHFPCSYLVPGPFGSQRLSACTSFDLDSFPQNFSFFLHFCPCYLQWVRPTQMDAFYSPPRGPPQSDFLFQDHAAFSNLTFGQCQTSPCYGTSSLLSLPRTDTLFLLVSNCLFFEFPPFFFPRTCRTVSSLYFQFFPGGLPSTKSFFSCPATLSGLTCCFFSCRITRLDRGQSPYHVM